MLFLDGTFGESMKYQWLACSIVRWVGCGIIGVCWWNTSSTRSKCRLIADDGTVSGPGLGWYACRILHNRIAISVC